MTQDHIVGDHVEYSFEVTHPNEGSWKFQRRYSALRTLHLNLVRVAQVSLPTFPPKKMFGNMKPAFVARRRQDLQNYFTEIVRIAHVVNSREFAEFIRPSDKVALQAKMNSVPVFSTPQSVPDLPKPSSQPSYNHEQTEKKYLQLVEDVSSFFINLASRSNPLEEEDVARKRREYSEQIQKSMSPVNWGSSPLVSVSLAETSLDRSLLTWIVREAGEVQKAWSSSHISEVSILSKPT